MKYSFFKNIWGSGSTRRSSTWIVITIAIVPLVMVQQIANNMIEGISLRIIETDSSHLSMNAGIYSTKTGRESVMSVLNKNPNVTFTYQELRGVGIIKNKNKKLGASFRGVDNSFFEEQGVHTYLKLERGTMKFEENNSIIIGKAVASFLDLDVGDTALFLTSQWDREMTLPRISRAVVTGIVTTGYEELDRSWVFMPGAKLQTLLLPDDQNWRIGIKISDPFLLDNDLAHRSKKEKEKGTQILSEITNLVSDQGVLYSWYELNRDKFNLFLSTKSLLYVAMLIAVILAVITLASAIGMRVIDLEFEIATLKAIGANPAGIEWQIMLQGIRNGFIGAVIGCTVGTILASQINYIVRAADFAINFFRNLLGLAGNISVLNPEFYLTEIEFRLYPVNLFSIIGMVLVFSAIASWFPSRKVRNIPSMKLLRRH